MELKEPLSTLKSPALEHRHQALLFLADSRRVDTGKREERRREIEVTARRRRPLRAGDARPRRDEAHPAKFPVRRRALVQ